MDKIKIRISDFVYMILCNDALEFGFHNKNGGVNMSGFLNKLLPNMLQMRRSRKEALFDEIMLTFENVTDEELGKIQDIVERVVDKVYFPDATQGTLVMEVWVRPTKKTSLAFMDMMVEASVSDNGMSTYLRHLLNEYSKLPEHTRERIVFSEEWDIAMFAGREARATHILANGEHLHGVLVDRVIGIAKDQRTYLFLYEFGTEAIRSVLLKDIVSIYTEDWSCDVPDEALERVMDICNNHLFLEQSKFPKPED